MRALRLARIGLNVGDLARAERFYREGFGFEPVGDSPLVIRLGRQEIELASFDPPGLPYPEDSTSADLWFQHFAIVVADMERACERIAAQPGFMPISRYGPQELPPNTGSVTAFKFRDPDGHPLELIRFPPAAAPAAWRNAGDSLFLGIDHSAISVGDVARSVAFYCGRLGLTLGSRSLNRGPEQARLDDLPDPVVEVVALEPAGEPTPHIELLGYRRPRDRPIPASAAPNDIAATRLLLEVEGSERESELVRDPDGHHLLLVRRS